jgi:hypothetical protein
MKYVYLIIASTVLILALNPGINSISLQTETPSDCCSKLCADIYGDQASEDKNQAHSKGNDCNGKPCNPFLFCGSCVLVSPVMYYEYLPSLISSQEKVFYYSRDFISSFISDFWHPPKIV